METTKVLLSELYTAYFNRAPDAAGLAYWEGELNSGSMDFDAIAQNWANEQPEFVQTYGTNPDSDTLINKVYENVLGRTPDSAGATYWSEQLANGNVSTSALIEAVVAGAKAPTGSAQDAQLLQNKATVGVQVADAGINDITFAQKAVQAVSADVNTVGIVTGLVSIAKTDMTALATATQTLGAVHTMLTDASTDTLATTIENLKSIIVSMVAEVSAGAVTDVSTTLQATTATVEAATQDPTYIADPLAVASNITSDPEAAQADANAVTEPTPTPSPSPAPAPDTTPPAMSSAVVNADGDIVITYTESIASSTPEASDYTVTVGANTPTISSVTKSGSTITLVMASKILGSDTVSSIVYSKVNGTADSIKDASNNAAADQTLSTVTNNSVYYTIAGATTADGNGTLPTTYKIVDTATNAATNTGGYITGSVNVTVTDAATVAQLNAIDAATTGVITATITEQDMTTLANLTDANANNALTVTVTDASVAAAALNTLDGKTSVPVDATATVTTLTGVASDVKAAYAANTAGTITGLGDEAVTLSGNTSVADEATIDAATTGVITATITEQDMTTLANLTDANANNDLTVTVTDASVAAAALNTLDGKTSVPVDATAVTTLTGFVSDVTTTFGAFTEGGTITGLGNVAVTITDANATAVTAADIKTIDDATTGAITITNSLVINGTADGSNTADNIDVSDITFTSGVVTINGNDGDDLIMGGSEADTINGGTGNDIIRGGAGADTLNGDAGNNTFVVLGTIAAGDYVASDVATTTGAYKLGLATLIDNGLATSDIGTNGTGETYAGGAGTNSIEIWGTADLTNATVSNISAINTHSTLNITATQLQTLYGEKGSSIDLNLLDSDSTINITGVTQNIGLQLLSYFGSNIDATVAAAVAGGTTGGEMPTINFAMDVLNRGSDVNYSIGLEDMIGTGNATDQVYTDQASQNSVINVTAGTTSTNVTANDGDDIIVVDAMSNKVTIDGGAGDDILLFSDTNGATTDLDKVTNVEIIALSGGAASITTLDTLVDNTVQTDGLAVMAGDLTGSLTFDGSAETDGYFRITGSDQADTITGGAKDDFIYADDTDIIDGGGNNTVNILSTPPVLGDTAIFTAAVSATNLINAHLVNIETVNITDIGSDNSEVYDFSAQSEGLNVFIKSAVDASGNSITTNNGVTVKGGSGDDRIIASNTGGANIIDGSAGGNDTIGNGDVDKNAAYSYYSFTTHNTNNSDSDTLLFYDSDLTALAGFADASASGGTLLTLADGNNKVEFVSGSGTQTASGAYAAFLYNTSTGELSFDADGTGANSAWIVGTLYSDGGNTAITDLSATDFTFLV